MITFTLRIFYAQHYDCYTFILCTVSRSWFLIHTSHLILVTFPHESILNLHWTEEEIIVDHLNCKMLGSVSNTVPRQLLLLPPQETAQQSCVSTVFPLKSPLVLRSLYAVESPQTDASREGTQSWFGRREEISENLESSVSTLRTKY